MIELYDYQEKIFNQSLGILEKNRIVCLAVACRLGKTFIALKLADAVRRSNEAVLFITKKKAIPSVIEDAEMAKIGSIDVINYESLHKIGKKSYSVIILDEFHGLGAFPKLNSKQKKVQSLFRLNMGCKAILLSGTPNIESRAQLFHPLFVTGLVFKGFSSFYKWHKDFGKPYQKMIAGRLVNKYDKVYNYRVMCEIGHLFTAMTQKEAGFKIEAKIRPIIIENKEIVTWCNRFKKTSVWYNEGYTVEACAGAAAVLSKQLQACGGTIIDDNEEGHILPDDLNPLAKVEWILLNLYQYHKICIFTNFVHERELIADCIDKTLMISTDNMEEFKNDNRIRFFIGSVTSYSEGYDLSKVDNCAVVLYSLTWSGKTFAQICERQQNKLRKEPITIYCPIIAGTQEVNLFKAVSSKQNFNMGFLKRFGSC